jgi:hypothetical protein
MRRARAKGTRKRDQGKGHLDGAFRKARGPRQRPTGRQVPIGVPERVPRPPLRPRRPRVELRVLRPQPLLVPLACAMEPLMGGANEAFRAMMAHAPPNWTMGSGQRCSLLCFLMTPRHNHLSVGALQSSDGSTLTAHLTARPRPRCAAASAAAAVPRPPPQHRHHPGPPTRRRRAACVPPQHRHRTAPYSITYTHSHCS